MRLLFCLLRGKGFFGNQRCEFGLVFGAFLVVAIPLGAVGFVGGYFSTLSRHAKSENVEHWNQASDFCASRGMAAKLITQFRPAFFAA